ncbi:MAG: membrane or secreted protein [Bacteroidetes bacterium HGW-Bacteroidetes-6]|jgi:flagellar basal body-associated protein FliL|nr:MAG: membrane or secreted protein [Bacteroidetes bacterium HGW-Bacteroidetes-6]
MKIIVVIIVVVVFIALAFVGIGIKMFLKKGGEFKKQCSTKDPQTGKALGCSCGGESTCHNE